MKLTHWADILTTGMKRTETENLIAELIARRVGDAPLRVAIDGIDASGKTTLANSLAPILAAKGRHVLRSSIDRFHNPSSIRYSRGVDSPEGYYWGSFNYPALVRELLQPLSPEGDRVVRLGVFNYRLDQTVEVEPQHVPNGTILLFDGVFLLRPEINDYWDFRIFIDVDFDVALERVLMRDQGAMGGPERTRERYLTRYYPGQTLYLNLVSPQQIAYVVVNNNDYDNPQLLVR
jgi:uridine kinase